MLLNNIIHDILQNMSAAIYAVRNHFVRQVSAQDTDDFRQREEEFWNSSVGREIAARIESELLREYCSR